MSKSVHDYGNECNKTAAAAHQNPHPLCFVTLWRSRLGLLQLCKEPPEGLLTVFTCRSLADRYLFSIKALVP